MEDIPLSIGDPLDEIAVAGMHRTGITDWLLSHGWTGVKLQMLGVACLAVSAYTLHHNHKTRTLSFFAWIVLDAMAFAVAFRRGDLKGFFALRLTVQVVVGIAFWRLIHRLNPESWTLWVAGWPATILSVTNAALKWVFVQYNSTMPLKTRANIVNVIRGTRWVGQSTWNFVYLFLMAGSGVIKTRP